MTSTGIPRHDSGFQHVGGTAGATIATAALSALSEPELDALAAWIAERNADATCHVGYVGVAADEVAADIADMEPGAVVAHAVSDGVRIGLMMAESDRESTRTWLHGPWTPDTVIADAMFAALAGHIPARNSEHEVYGDELNTAVTSFADRHGMAPAGAFDLMRVARGQSIGGDAATSIVPFAPQHTDAFFRLHARIHPTAHRAAEQIIAGGVPLLIAVEGDTVLGYASSNTAPDSAIGTIEHLGVDPELASDRWTRVHGDLLTATVNRILADPTVSHVDIVAKPERAQLYQRYGFRLLRAMRAFRNAPAET